MSEINNRPTRSGATQANTSRVRPVRGSDRPAGTGPDLAYLTSGSSALAPVPEFAPVPEVDEPIRTRTAGERELADLRAAERAQERATGHAVAQERRRLRVAPPIPVAVARAPFVAMLLVIVVAGVVGILVLNTMINANQFRLNNLQSQQAGLDQQEQTLQQDLAQQEAPGSLVAAARKLGLVPAGTLAYIQMPNGQVVGVPQPATHTTSVTDQGSAGGTPSTGGTPPATPSGTPSGR